MGYSVMAIALVADKMRPLLAAYREAWKAAGHPGDGEVMIAFHMFCDADGERARAFASPLIDAYLAIAGRCRFGLARRPDLAGLSRLRQDHRRRCAPRMRRSRSRGRRLGRLARTRSPRRSRGCSSDFGGFEHASLQVNFNMMPSPEALASMRLFARR